MVHISSDPFRCWNKKTMKAKQKRKIDRDIDSKKGEADKQINNIEKKTHIKNSEKTRIALFSL